MSFLDDKIFGLVRSVADATNTYTARQRLKFTGSVTLTDDPTTNTTTVDITGGGGGGGSPWNAAPANVDLLASSGSSALYARGDHVHALRSSDLQAIAANATGPWNYNSKEIQSLGAPTTPNSAARLSDITALSPMHPPVRALDIGYGTPYTGLVTVSGVALVAGDRYGRLGDGGNNGIWVVQAGAHTRALDWAVGRVLRGDCFIVLEGTDYPGQMICCYGPPAIVGTNAANLDTVNRPETLYGDVTEISFGTRVVRLRGDLATSSLGIEARSIKHSEDFYNTFSKVYHSGLATGSTTPAVAQTHTFSSATGAIKAIAEVDFINAAGTVESFHLRETRKFDGVGTATPVGVISTLYTPVAPTGAVAFVWGVNSVNLTVTAPNTGATRWNVNLQVFEMPAA